MKRVLLSLTLLVALASGLTSCKDYDDTYVKNKLNDHEQRISALEEWQKTVNQDITFLQTIVSSLEKKDYVTSVTKLADDAGYTLSFQNSGDVTIKNGKDGRDGADGHSPKVSVKQYSDGRYYWTIDGEYIYDDKGNMLPVTGNDGKDGTDGKDGVDGKDGNNAIAPQVKIENDYWYISTDGGKTWTKNVKATGDDGEQGEKGESFFYDVDVNSGDNYITLTLANKDGNAGETIKLPFYSASSMYFENCVATAVEYISLFETKKLTIVLPEDLTKDNCANLIATITHVKGSSYTPTRSHDNSWTVTVGTPNFDSHKVSVTINTNEGEKNNRGELRIGDQALITMTLTYKDKTQITITRLIENTGIGNKIVNDAEIGDFFMSDGSIIDHNETMTNEQKTNCIGIVFTTDTKRIGDVEKEQLQLYGKSPHGLVLATKSATSNGSVNWCSNKVEKDILKLDNIQTLTDKYNDINGFGNYTFIKWQCSDNMYQYPVFYAAFTFSTEAPWAVTDWFIPSIGQLWDILVNLGGWNSLNNEKGNSKKTSYSGSNTQVLDNLNAYMSKAGGDAFVSGEEYVSSSEYDEDHVCVISATDQGESYISEGLKTNSEYNVRCVLAF